MESRLQDPLSQIFPNDGNRSLNTTCSCNEMDVGLQCLNMAVDMDRYANELHTYCLLLHSTHRYSVSAKPITYTH